MDRINLKMRCLGFLVLVVWLSLPGAVGAQNSAGVGIKPAIIEDKLDPASVKQFSVAVTNLNPVEKTFYLSKRDIIGVRDGGVPVFAPVGQERSGLELSEWITLETDQVTIAAGGSATVSFILSIPEQASPGSHFGGIMVSAEPPEIRSTGAAIGYEVANIISIRVSGEAVEQARVRQFATEKYFHGDSLVNFEIRIENEGNTLIKPVGPITITNMLGTRSAQLTFNDSAAGVFPLSSRDFRLSWQSDKPGFGRYQAVFTATYGEEGAMKSLDATATFWIIPMDIVLPALVALLVLFGIVYVSIKLYVRRTVALLTAGSARRLVRSRSRSDFPVLLLVVSLLTVTALLLIILLALFA